MSELYTGTKFTSIFLDNTPPQHECLSELISWCELFQKNGLTPAHNSGTSGNLSYRITTNSSEFIITGTGLQQKDTLTNEHFVLVKSCDIAQKTVSVFGCRQPSSESMMHYAIYQTSPHIHAIFHGHHQGILAYSDKLQIPVTEQECEYGSTELIESVLPLIEKNVHFFILKNHGFISVGQNMTQSANTALRILQRYKTLEEMKG